HVYGFAGHHLVAASKTLRGQGVAQLAVLVLHQRDEGRAVRVVFKALDRADDIQLAALEVDDTVGALVTAADEAGGDTTVVVAAARLGQTLGQTLDRLALVQAGAVDDDQLAGAWRDRVVMFQCHFLILAASLTGPLRRRS